MMSSGYKKQWLTYSPTSFKNTANQATDLNEQSLK